MPRIKIDFPATLPFKTNIPVRITDLNYGGHLGNDTILTIVHEARVQYLRQWGYTELNVAGVGLIMSDAAIEFKGEAFYGDILEISIGAGELTRIGFELFYLIETEREGKRLPIAKVKTAMSCFDYQARKIVSVPQEVAAHFMP